MIGTGELIVIFCVILLLFGGKKLPELARSLGKGIREFKRATQGLDQEEPTDAAPTECVLVKSKIEEPLPRPMQSQNHHDE